MPVAGQNLLPGQLRTDCCLSRRNAKNLEPLRYADAIELW